MLRHDLMVLRFIQQNFHSSKTACSENFKVENA